MDTIMIGQGYNLAEDTSVGKELIEQFNSGRYDSFTCLVAFASYGGISALTPYIQKEKARGVKINVIVGIDQKGTSKEALEEVLSWNVESKIYHTQSVNIFHPKIYLFENTDIFTLIVGSNNLTEMGLVKNIECSLLIKDIKSNPVHDNFYKYWKSILDGTEVNLYPITKDLIDELYEDNLITSENLRSARYDDGSDKESSSIPKKIKFRKSLTLQKNPNGFNPKRLVKIKSKDETTSSGNTDISIEVGNEVLIAEIGGGPRWKQVNFPVKIFEEFFGAERGDNSYNIKLYNVGNNGIVGEEETRQAVSVKSHNYRFEINCAETNQKYPDDENRPIGLFIKIADDEFLYQVLLSDNFAYDRIKDYLYLESDVKRAGELRRCLAHIEAIHAIYPELII